MKGKIEFVYRTFVFQSVVIWNTIFENINISLVRFKHSLNDFLVFNETLLDIIDNFTGQQTKM